MPRTIDATIWVLIDGDGRFVADACPDNLRDEYAVDVAPPDLGQPLALVKVLARVPVPQAVEVAAHAVVPAVHFGGPV